MVDFVLLKKEIKNKEVDMQIIFWLVTGYIVHKIIDFAYDD